MIQYLVLITALFTVMNAVAIDIKGEKDIPFNGRIIGKDNSGIKKVKVSLVKSGAWTKSNKEGYFAFLNVPDNDTLLLESKEWLYAVPIEGRKSIKIMVLNEGDGFKAWEDEELTNLGYANIRDASRTNSDNIIYGEDFRTKGLTDIYKILQMYVPGISFFDCDDGHKGVSLRFSPTFHDMGEAIYFLDGVRINNLDRINVWDIDKIEIIKEGNIYGMEGANGAILISNRKK